MQLIERAIAHHRSGQLQQAEALYREALSSEPGNFDATHLLGLLRHQSGHHAEGLDLIERALRMGQDSAFVRNSLGEVQLALGRPAEAEIAYRRAIELKPDYVEARFGLGNVLLGLGRGDEAVAAYLSAVAAAPEYAEAHYNLGVTWQTLGRLDEAIGCYQKALSLDPAFARAHYNLGVALQDQNKLGLAAASYRNALALSPQNAEAENNLGNTIGDQGRYDLAVAHYRRAIEINPNFASAHYNLGFALADQGDLDEAMACYQRAESLGLANARVRAALMLPPIMGTKDEVLESRSGFERNLDQLIADGVRIDDPTRRVGITNFYLAFHGLNDRPLQEKVAQFYERACPDLLYVAPHCTRPRREGRLRVGFLTRFVFTHSISRCMSRIIEELSHRSEFEVSLISSHDIEDEAYRNTYAAFAGNRVQLSLDYATARKRITALELDVLVYLDIGMDPWTYFLAYSRLAHVQCVYGGHPVTTGIRNLDYFLSQWPAFVESDEADSHYSEKLVRFPHGLFYFERPSLPAVLKTRRELGLPENRRLYVCPMKLQKLHPDFDVAMSRILELDEEGVIVLFEDHQHATWRQMLERRLDRTISASVRARICFMPWLFDYADFVSANGQADVVIDPFHFGIGTTAIATFALGTPLVTLPSEFLRGRQGMAFCRMLGLEDCIATGVEDYAQKAVAIAKDPSVRNSIKKRILENEHVLYGSLEPVGEFEKFLVDAIGRPRTD